MTVSFYCVTGRDFFPGAVALLNSLRLVGHEEPLHVLDCGLEPRQRELLAAHAEVVDAPDDAPPSLQKLVLPLSHPAETMALLDADVIVTRPLTELIERAAGGRLVAFSNDSDRFFAEWSELLDLGSLRRGPYLSTGALFVGGTAAAVLAEAQQRLGRLERGATWLEGGDERRPLFYADQDVINAVVMARLTADRVVALDGRLAAIPPFTGLQVCDAERLRCMYRDAQQPYLLHHYFRKPWLVRMRSNPYSRLFTRLLLGDDVALRLDPQELPPRLRRGPLAAAARAAVDVGIGIPASVRRRLFRRAPRIEAWSDARPSEGSPR
jgi:hypothetical protein